MPAKPMSSHDKKDALEKIEQLLFNFLAPFITGSPPPTTQLGTPEFLAMSSLALVIQAEKATGD